MMVSLYVLPIKTAVKEVVSLRGKARGKMWHTSGSRRNPRQKLARSSVDELGTAAENTPAHANCSEDAVTVVKSGTLDRDL